MSPRTGATLFHFSAGIRMMPDGQAKGVRRAVEGLASTPWDTIAEAVGVVTQWRRDPSGGQRYSGVISSQATNATLRTTQTRGVLGDARTYIRRRRRLPTMGWTGR